jgi:hypothetical protein
MHAQRCAMQHSGMHTCWRSEGKCKRSGVVVLTVRTTSLGACPSSSRVTNPSGSSLMRRVSSASLSPASQRRGTYMHIAANGRASGSGRPLVFIAMHAHAGYLTHRAMAARGPVRTRQDDARSSKEGLPVRLTQVTLQEARQREPEHTQETPCVPMQKTRRPWCDIAAREHCEGQEELGKPLHRPQHVYLCVPLPAGADACNP